MGNLLEEGSGLGLNLSAGNGAVWSLGDTTDTQYAFSVSPELVYNRNHNELRTDVFGLGIDASIGIGDGTKSTFIGAGPSFGQILMLPAQNKYIPVEYNVEAGYQYNILGENMTSHAIYAGFNLLFGLNGSLYYECFDRGQPERDYFIWRLPAVAAFDDPSCHQAPTILIGPEVKVAIAPENWSAYIFANIDLQLRF